MSVWFGGYATAVTNRPLRNSPTAPAMIQVLALITLSLTQSNASAGDSKWFQAHRRGSARIIAQAAATDEREVSSDEVEKYVSVYKAMQRNRSMTIDQAAAAQGLSTKQFRDLENRVQRDDAALQQARQELQAAAQASPPGRGSAPLRP